MVKKVLFLFCCMFAHVIYAQNMMIKGTVIDANNDPLLGVTIMVKGTTTGTITDVDGNFSIKGKTGETLIVSYIGMQTQEVVFRGQPLKIMLKDDAQALEEVVVVGYGTMRKKDLTGSVIQVRPDKIANENPKTVQDILRGTPGLAIGYNADAKGGGSMNIRGQRSVYTDGNHNSPLLILDGMMFYGELSEIITYDIGQIDVLKDASAAAIYGTRGANGVILITTKNGQRESRTAANYSGYMSLSKFGKTLDFYGAEEIRQGLTNYADKGYDTDWLDAVSRTAFTHNHNFNISGGSKNTTYSADFTYRKEEGVLLETYNEEMRMRFDVSHWMLNDMLKVNFNMVKTFHKNGPIDAAGLGIYRQAIMRNPTEPIWNEDGTFYENFAVNYYYNPVGIIREQDGKYNSENTRMTGNITFEPIKNWQTNLMLSRRVTSDHNRGYYTSEYFSQKSENHTGYAYHSQNEYTTDNLEVTSKYNHTWNKHRFDALVGYNYQYNVNEGFGANNYDYPTDFYLWNNLGLGTAL